MEFTLENTARATHAAGHNGKLVFIDLSNKEALSATNAYTGEWGRLSSFHDPDVFIELVMKESPLELIRSQGGINSLFDGAPDATNSYAKLKNARWSTRYWLCVDGYWLASGEDNEFYPFDEEGPDYMNFKESEFEIIATRPVKAKETVDVPVDESTYTQEILLSSGGYSAWVPCKVIFTGNRHTILKTVTGKEHCRKTSKLKLRDIDLRTEKEKAFDSFWNNLAECADNPRTLEQSLKIAFDAGVEWVGK